MDNDLMARRLRPPSEPTNPLDPFDVKSQVARNWQLAGPSTDAVTDESADAWDPPALSQGEVDAPWAATAQDAPNYPDATNYPDAPASAEAAVFPDAPALPEAPVFPEDPLFPESTTFPEAPALPETPPFADAFGYAPTSDHADSVEAYAEQKAYAEPDTYVEPHADVVLPADAAATEDAPAFEDAPEFDHDLFARAAAAQFANAFASVFGAKEPDVPQAHTEAEAPADVQLAAEPETTPETPAWSAPEARNDVPWDRPDDYEQPTDTAVVGQLAFDEPAWDKPAAESWADAEDAEDSTPPYMPSPNGRGSDFDFPAWSGAAVATAVAAEVASAPVETEAVAEAETPEEEAAADPDDAYAPVLGDVPAATARAWPETNGHDVSRNGSTVTAEPFVLSPGGSTVDYVADPAVEPFVHPLAPEESESTWTEPAESDLDWEEPAAAKESSWIEPTATATDDEMPAQSSSDWTAEPVEPADYAERGVGPTPPADLFFMPTPEPEPVDAPWPSTSEAASDEEAPGEPDREAEAALVPLLLETDPAVDVAPAEVHHAHPAPQQLVLRIELALVDDQLKVVSTPPSEVKLDDLDVTTEVVEVEPQAVEFATPVATEPEPEPEFEAEPEPVEAVEPTIPPPSEGPAPWEAKPAVAAAAFSEVAEPFPTEPAPAEQARPLPAALTPLAAPEAAAPTPEPVPSPWEPAPQPTVAAQTTEALMAAFAPAAAPPPMQSVSEPVFAPPPSIEPQAVAQQLVDPWAAPAEPDWGQPTAFEPLAPQTAQQAPVAAAAATLAAPAAVEQNDLWFLSTEPQETAEAVDVTTATAETAKQSSSVLTAGLTIGMAILVIVLVLVFIQLMTSILR